MTRRSLSSAVFCVAALIAAALIAAALIAAAPHALAQAATPQSSTRNATQHIAQPPIAIRFNMPTAGYATLVIEDAQGKRVRNLVSETPFAAGKNTVYWDGLDDLGRDVDAARHGLYHVPGALVTPGTYTVRGLTRDKITLRYGMSVYNAGSPSWETADHTGGWLAQPHAVAG